jgi:hypothetical protein
MRDPEKSSRSMAKIRRQHVMVYLNNGKVYEHPICDMAIPTPDGKFFLVRDLSKSEKRDDAIDVFHNTDLVERVEITSKRYDLLADGTRVEEALDTEPVPGVLITEEKKS